MPRAMPLHDVHELSRRYLAGESVESLRHATGISAPSITKILKRAGVPTRGLSEAMRLRMERMGPAGRRSLAAAAHAATRDSVVSQESAHRRAASRAQSLSKVGAEEVELMTLLRQRGAPCTAQEPVGGYNVDIGVHFGAARVAVEVHRHTNNPLTRPDKTKRIADLIAAGWHVLYIWINPKTQSVGPRCADDAIEYFQSVRDEAVPRAAASIRGDRRTK